MIWLTWRQHRIEVIVGSVIVVVAIAYLLMSVPASFAVQSQQSFVSTITALFSIFPLLIGTFLGAPIVAREVEQGTHRLVWIQSITRSRWLLEKTGLLAGVIALFAIVLGIAARFWGNPVNIWWSYDIQVPVLLSYSVYALILGIAISTIVRKTVAAIALTIPAFLLPRVGIFALRSFFLPTLSYTWDPNQLDPRGALSDWRVAGGLVNQQGQAVSEDYAHQLCESNNGGSSSDKLGSLNQCWHDHGFLQQVSYHPASQFWLFQSIEAAIFLVLAALLLGLTVWFLKHRVN